MLFFFLFLSFSTGLGFSFLFFLVGREGTFLLGSQQEVDPPLSFSPLCSILLDLQQVTWAYRLHREVDLYFFQSRCPDKIRKLPTSLGNMHGTFLLKEISITAHLFMDIRVCSRNSCIKEIKAMCVKCFKNRFLVSN